MAGTGVARWRRLQRFARCTYTTDDYDLCRNAARWARIMNGREQRACGVHRKIADKKERPR